MQQGLKEVLQAAAAGGLFGLQGADFGHAGGELLLQWEWWKRELQSLMQLCQLMFRGLVVHLVAAA